MAAGALGAATILPNLVAGRDLFTPSATVGYLTLIGLAAAAFLTHYLTAERVGESSRKEPADE